MIEVLYHNSLGDDRLDSAKIWPVQDICLADQVCDHMMEVTGDLYIPNRKLERFILDEPFGVSHRQNNVEHMGHVTYVFDSVYDNRHELGVHFSEDFSYHDTRMYLFYHDVHEPIAGDYDAMRKDMTFDELQELKERKNREALIEMEKNPATRFAAKVLKQYQNPKPTVEKGCAHDFEKITDICAIIHDNGRIWKNHGTSLEFMLQRRGQIMKTPWGKTMLGAFGLRLAQRPELFPESKTLFKV